MKNKREHILALKITGVLLFLFIFSFGIFIYLNYKLSLEREKSIFLNNLKSVPSKYIINLLEGKIPYHKKEGGKGPGNTIYKKLFQNFHIKIGEKEYDKGFFFENYIKTKLINNLKNREIKVFRFSNEKILAYKISMNNITLIIAKDISYIFDAIHRLVCISIFLVFLSLFLFYYISLKLAYKTTISIREANKKLKEYNYNVAHELKTPLSVIKSNLELLEIFGKLDLDILESSKQELNFMQDIIDSLLFLSENEVILKKDIIFLKQEITSIIDKYFYKDKITFDVNINKKVKVYFNKKLFDILIKNLLENSLKYGIKSGKIKIIFAKNTLFIKNKIKENSNIDVNKVFDTFYKSDNSRTGKGFGLGLNIVKKIVELHNYNIKVEIINNIFEIFIKIKL